MDAGSLVVENLLTPPILFFFVGVAAALLKSSLEIPQPLPKILSLYLLFAIGFKGGAELAKSGLGARELSTLLAAVGLSLAMTATSYLVLRRRLDAPNAAAVAASFGSISAVTFLTAAATLAALGIAFGGYMVAAMALMESPAIVLAVAFVRRAEEGAATGWRELFRDAFLNGSIFLLLASLVVGVVSGEKGHEALAPLTDGLFKGVLTLFLLDMGLVAARRLRDLKRAGGFLVGFGLVAPVVHGLVGIGAARLLGLRLGDALLLTVLCASASYIAVPAAMRLAVPAANPSLYVPLALAVTFPFNVTVGIPLYLTLLRAFGATP